MANTLLGAVVVNPSSANQGHPVPIKATGIDGKHCADDTDVLVTIDVGVPTGGQATA